MADALVIGAGPAGLMAADQLARAGHNVIIAEAMPSPARKLLMAGKSGLNVTNDQPIEVFLAVYSDTSPAVQAAIRDFGPDQVQAWLTQLGQPWFKGSTGRIYPKSMKASPLLRAWLTDLGQMGVEIRTRWRWRELQGKTAVFDTPEGETTLSPDVIVMAMGGASWSRLGSDGVWASRLDTDRVSPFEPSNAGVVLPWSPHMARHFGSPIKGCALHSGTSTTRGEFVISQHGLEGGGIYQMTRALRAGHPLTLDLAPDRSLDDLRDRLNRPRGKASFSNHLRKVLGFGPSKIALINEFLRPLPADLAPLIKAIPVPVTGFYPIDMAISTAGGLKQTALNDTFMVKGTDGLFACGEMLDWDAPTGGYLVTACLATGRAAGLGAIAYLKERT